MPEKLTVQKLTLAEARAHFRAYHYAKGVGNAAMCWGLPDGNGGHYAVAAYAVPCSQAARAVVFGEADMHRVYDLQRLARRDDCPVSMSQFMAATEAALLDYRPDTRALTAFADTTEGHTGGVYRASNWTECGGSASARTFYRDSSGRLRHRHQDGRNISPSEAISRGWTLESRCAKVRFVKVIGPDRRERRFWTSRVIIPEYRESKGLSRLCAAQVEETTDA